MSNPLELLPEQNKRREQIAEIKIFNDYLSHSGYESTFSEILVSLF